VRIVAPAITGLTFPVALLFAHESWLQGGLVLSPRSFMEAGRNPVDWRSPHFLDVLFSCQHGLVYWTPILGLGLIGICLAALREPWARMALATVLAHVWLIGGLSATAVSWSGGSAFGMRYMTENGVFFAMGLAWLQGRLQRTATRWAAGILLASLVTANLGLLALFTSKRISQDGCVTYRDMGGAALDLIGATLACRHGVSHAQEP
jgi:hypothetical protein